MLLAHGKLLPDSARPQVLSRLREEIDATLAEKRLAPEVVMDALAALGARVRSGEFDDLLARYLPPGVTAGELLPLLSRDFWEEKLRAELGEDPFAPKEQAETVTRRLPLGVLLHIAAGNQPGLPVYSALEGLLTGNINLLKLPHADKGLSLAALSLLCQTQPALADFLYAFDLPSSSTQELQTLAGLADGVVTWGSDAAILAARRLAGPNCKLMEWGHRLSFAYLSGDHFPEEDLAALAEHILSTGGRLCSSCQIIYLDTADRAFMETFCEGFAPILGGMARRFESTRALSSLYGHTALLERVVTGKALGEKVFRDHGCSLIACDDPQLDLSPMEGNVFVKCLPKQQILPVLRTRKQYLQTAALLCPPRDRALLTELLARSGVTRVTRPGHMSAAFPGEAHDGEYPLARYTKLVDIEK